MRRFCSPNKGLRSKTKAGKTVARAAYRRRSVNSPVIRRFLALLPTARHERRGALRQFFIQFIFYFHCVKQYYYRFYSLHKNAFQKNIFPIMFHTHI
jgi:hypothetical protein